MTQVILPTKNLIFGYFTVISSITFVSLITFFSLVSSISFLSVFAYCFSFFSPSCAIVV